MVAAMEMALSDIDRPRPLAEFMSDAVLWPRHESLRLLHALTEQVGALHRRGQIHRAIDATTVLVDARRRPQLEAPPATRSFGGFSSEPEYCPPELADRDACDLPGDARAAAAVLAAHGLTSVDPRRIDLYQLGVLCCRLLSGESLQGYLYSPGVKAAVAADVRGILDRALGYDNVARFQDCESLAAALDQCLQSSAKPAAAAPSDTKSFIDQGTRSGVVRARSQTDEDQSELPLARLGSCRIIKKLGQGGMGDVYQAYDESLDRLVAIKILPPQLARDREFVRRFRAEASSIAKLLHPHVVQVFSIGEEQGHHYFVMQFVAGESLAQRLHREARLELDAALKIFEQCLTGLVAAHQAHLIHRDIKPGNILLDTSGNALLADFGLVKQADRGRDATASGVILGTVDYLSPEQARGQPVDERSDLYSMGVLLYEMLSGHLPFDADSATAMVFQHAYEAPRPLHEVLADVPPALEAMIDRLLQKKPEERYPSAKALLADVRAYRSASGTESRTMRRVSAVLPAPELLAEPVLPPEAAELTPTDRRGRRWDRLRSIFQRRAPAFVKQLQSTSLQVDLAIEQYARRRQLLAEYVAEARQVEAELAAQLKENIRAEQEVARRANAAATENERELASAQRAACHDNIVALQAQCELQRQQLANMESKLVGADATLARLQSQRDMLHARLKAAHARRRVEGRTTTARNPWRRLGYQCAAALAAMGIGVYVMHRLTGHGQSALVLQEEWSAEHDHRAATADATHPPQGGKPAAITGVPTAAAFRRSMGGGYELLVADQTGIVRSVVANNRNASRGGATYAEHLRKVNGLAVSPEGARLATASDDHSICIWDCEEKRVIRRLQGHNDAVISVAFSNDGGRLLSASKDGTVRIWDVQRETELNSVNISSTRAWVTWVAWSSDEGSFLLASRLNGAPSLCLCDASSGEDIRAYSDVQANGRSEFAAFLPNGRQVVSITAEKLIVWDRETGQLERIVADVVSAAALSPDGRFALTAGAQGAALWNLADGSMIRGIDGPTDGITAVAMSPDARNAAICLRDGRLQLVDLAELPPPEGQLQAFSCSSPVHVVAFSPDGFYALSGDESDLRLWSLRKPSAHYSYHLDRPISAAAFTRDGTQVLYATGHRNSRQNFVGLRWHTENKATQFWEARDLRHFEVNRGRLVSTAFLPGDERVVAADSDGDVKIWDLAGEQELISFKVGLPINAFAVSPDGAQALVAAKENAVQVWDLAAQTKVKQLLGHTFHVTSAAYGNRDRACTGGADRTVRVWNVATGDCLATLIGHEGRVNAVCLMPDGDFVVSASDDRTVRLWNVASQQEIQRFEGHWGPVNTLAISPDQSSVLSGGEDSYVRLWALKLPRN